MAGPTLRKHRLACDRCNSLKLKCTKLDDADSCSRCIRASAACTFSPSIRGLKSQAREKELRRLGLEVPDHRYRQTQPTGRSSFSNDLANTRNDIDSTPIQANPWVFGIQDLDSGNPAGSFPDFQGQGSSSPAQSQAQANNVPDCHAGMDKPLGMDWTNGMNFAGGDTLPDSIQQLYPDTTPISQGQSANNANKSANRQLAEIFIQLEDQAATIPPITTYETQEEYSEAAAAFNTEQRGERMPVFSIQQLFELSQDLVDTYPRFCQEYFESSAQLRGLREDNAAIFLALSCYHRLVDIWMSIFSHVEYGAKMGRFSRHNLSQTSTCQRLRIGSFVPTTKVPLEIVLGVEFQKQLVEQISDFARRVRSAADSGSQTLRMTHDTTQDLVTRSKKLLDEALRIQAVVEYINSSDTDSTSPGLGA